MKSFYPLSPSESPQSLRSVMRPAPTLAPEDTLARFVRVRRISHADTLPVTENGILCGIVSYKDVISLLADTLAPENDERLFAPVAEIMRPPLAAAHPMMTPGEVGALCARYELDSIPVVDADGFVLGMIRTDDLLIPDSVRPKPASVGGMATPFGVYLTDGEHQAGVGNFALVASGASIGLMFLLSFSIVGGILSLGQTYAQLPLALNLGDAITPSNAAPALVFGWLIIKTAAFALLMLLMRGTRIAGYHAAEHQTVHAIERDEPLIPHVVARMPRPHPRCGTNLMAAGFLGHTSYSLIACVPYIGDFAYLFAALFTLTTWRRFGTFLQARFTTRQATEREIKSGIAAGESILRQYVTNPPARHKALRRIWCMGILQSLAGMLLVMGAAGAIDFLWETYFGK